MIAYLLLFCSALYSALRIRRDLVLENLALRHQLLVLSRSSRDCGPVNRDLLLARAWLVYWPPGKVRLISHSHRTEGQA